MAVALVSGKYTGPPLLAEIRLLSRPTTFLFSRCESETLMFGVEAVSSYVLTLGLLTVFVLVWVTRQQKTKKDATSSPNSSR